MTEYVRVPREPTEAMIAAGERAAWDDDNSMPAISAMRKAWPAMLAASPKGEGSSADWIKHDGGPNPVPGKMVDVTLRSSDVLGNQHADGESWMHIWGQADIIAYRVTEGVKP